MARPIASALVASLLLGACSPTAGQLTQATPGTIAQLIHLGIARSDEDSTAKSPAEQALADVSAEAELSHLTAPLAQDGPAGTTVRVLGRAYVTGDFTDIANVTDGKVVGGALAIRDALTKKIMARGVTYYDGSFLVDVPIKRQQHAALVEIDLYHRTDPALNSHIVSPFVLRNGEAETRVVVSPGSTALSDLLTELANPKVGAINLSLGTLIATFDANTRVRFAQLAENSAELKGAYSLAGLRDGIRQYVQRVSATRSTPTPSPSPN